MRSTLPVKKKPAPTLKKLGRPSKYRPEYCQELIDYMAKGYDFKSFAGKIHVTNDTLLEWVKVHEAFSLAYKRARAEFYKFWDEQAVAAKNDKTINTAMLIFLLKNKLGYRDNLDHNIDSKIDNQITVNIRRLEL